VPDSDAAPHRMGGGAPPADFHGIAPRNAAREWQAHLVEAFVVVQCCAAMLTALVHQPVVMRFAVTVRVGGRQTG
jgi:hypothetical protein